MSLPVLNCPKAKLNDKMVSMVTKLDIPVITLLIRCFIVKRDTSVSLSCSLTLLEYLVISLNRWNNANGIPEGSDCFSNIYKERDICVPFSSL